MFLVPSGRTRLLRALGLGYDNAAFEGGENAYQR